MAGESISQLPAASSLNLGDLVAVTQGSTGPGTGTTFKCTWAQLVTLLATQGFLMANQPIPPDSGNYNASSVELNASTYTSVLGTPSQNRKLLIMQAPNQGAGVLLQFGGSSPPGSDVGAYFLPPNESWPPPAATNLVSNDTVWAKAASGTPNLTVITA